MIYHWAFWVVGGLLAMAAELLLPGAFLVWVGLAAVGTGLLILLLAPGLAGIVLCFILLLGLGIGLSLRFLGARGRSGGSGGGGTLNSPASGLVGRSGIWLGADRVRVGDSDWPGRAPGALIAGAAVRVVAVEGMTLRVEPD